MGEKESREKFEKDKDKKIKKFKKQKSLKRSVTISLKRSQRRKLRLLQLLHLPTRSRRSLNKAPRSLLTSEKKTRKCVLPPLNCEKTSIPCRRIISVFWRLTLMLELLSRH